MSSWEDEEMSIVSVLGPTSAVRTGNGYAKDSVSGVVAWYVRALDCDGLVGDSVRLECEVQCCELSGWEVPWQIREGDVYDRRLCVV